MSYTPILRAVSMAVFLSSAQIASAEETTAPESMGPDAVIASVNGTDITLGHVRAAVRGLPPQFQGLPDDQLFEGIVTQIIQQELLKQSSDTDVSELRYDLDNQERSVIAGAAIEAIGDAAVTEEALQAAYDERFAAFEPQREYNAAHILVGTEEEALALVEELDGGAEFAELAREKSTGPSGPNGGNLGWFGQGMMVAPFEEAVIAMKAGEISAPVQTQFGWHVINLIETRLASAPALDTVREELAMSLRENAVRTQVETMQAEAEVMRVDGFDPSLIRADTQ